MHVILCICIDNDPAANKLQLHQHHRPQRWILVELLTWFQSTQKTAAMRRHRSALGGSSSTIPSRATDRINKIKNSQRRTPSTARCYPNRNTRESCKNPTLLICLVESGSELHQTVERRRSVHKDSSSARTRVRSDQSLHQHHKRWQPAHGLTRSTRWRGVHALARARDGRTHGSTRETTSWPELSSLNSRQDQKDRCMPRRTKLSHRQSKIKKRKEDHQIHHHA